MQSSRLLLVGITASLALTSLDPALAEEPGASPLMRFPDMHGDLVVFVHGEDIWSAPISGGIATRLTMNDGEERFPKFSPDGNLIAFTGEYDGNADVYVMNRYGGEIRRVTFHPGHDHVIGWHPGEQKILFSSARRSFRGFTRLYLIAPDGRGLEELDLHEAGAGSFSPDGQRIAYNRNSRESRTWKRYRGGTAQEIYLYNFETKEERKLTHFEGTDRIPMWIGKLVYFSSDRDGVLNLYAGDPVSGEIEQLTQHSEYDVRRPSAGKHAIVYELAGTLWLYDIPTRRTRRVPIEIRADAPEVRPRLERVDEWMTGLQCSPTGQRVLVVARGEVFTVPRKDGPTRNLTCTSGARERDAAWSPDGQLIAYLSDINGENDIYAIDALGRTAPRRLTDLGPGYRHTLRWSPDSRRIAFADQTLRCHYVDVDSRRVTEIDQAAYENVDVALNRKPIFDFAWSPDSRFIAYSMMNADLVYQLYIYSLDSRERHCVSNGIFNDFGPVFTDDGEHLLFVSNRRFDPTFCDFEWEMVYKRAAGIYSLVLRADGPTLLPLRSDEEGAAPEAAREGEVRVDIDFPGLAERIEALPLPRGNYRELAHADKTVYYLEKEEGDFNRFEYRAVGERTLYGFSITDREERTIVGGVEQYSLSADGKHIAYLKDRAIGMLASSAEHEVDEVAERRRRDDEDEFDDSREEAHARRGRGVHGRLDLRDLKMWLDPRAEWQQIYDEAWRMERDFFYDPNMHGLDWDGLRAKYGALIPHAVCRQDIRYIIGELIGELSTSHTYVSMGARHREPERVNVGMLGVDWEIDGKHQYYRFGKICRIPDWSREILPPLARPGATVSAGEYLLAVNGTPVTTDRNIYSYFQDLAREQVSLLVSERPTTRGAREIIVEPLGDESTLRYLDWVEGNRRRVDELSDGTIGYLHLPDTYAGSAREFPKYFYSQTRKQGLIVDGRFNGGGLDPDIFLQRLDKKILSYWTRRYSHDQTSPAVATRAHLVCLTNYRAGSGGDMLPMEFQMRKMGPVIGTRTWGGLVGISMWIDFVDGGGISAPDYRIYDRSGNWIVENVGVVPDIEVDLHPAEMARGHDAQLLKAVEVLQDEIARDPRPWPEHGPIPAMAFPR